MKFIILLRGINVGGRKIKMQELRSCLEEAGYRNVITVLQTGNVILNSDHKNKDKLRKQVETLLTDTFNYPAKVLLITPEQLEEVIHNYPFQSYDPEFHRYAVFTENGQEKEIIKQCDELDKNIEEISPGKNVIYWRVLKGHTLDSTFGKYMAKTAAKNFLTNRNLNTLEKILAKNN